MVRRKLIKRNNNNNTKLIRKTKQLIEENEILKADVSDYQSLTSELVNSRNKLIEHVKELEESNKWLQRELKEAWSEGETHLGAMRIASELAEEKFSAETEKLKDELNNEREIRQDFVERLAKKIVENDKMIESRNEERRGREEEIRKNLKKDEIIEKLKAELYLANKLLPKQPSKFKILKEKTKTKFQNLIEKTKQRSQELIANIEVRTK